MKRTHKPRAADGVARAVLLCFFLSGLSALIYQVIWVRELVLIFGATTFAASTVLTAFMGGLAIGGYYFGRKTREITRPLRLYGILEIGIGCYGLLVPLIFALLPRIYHPLIHKVALSFFALTLLRFVLVALVLILPTALMGATLPVLASFYARGSSRVGLKVGSLYSLNTFGAVLGAAISGFFLIPSLGMRLSTVTAAAINLALGTAALVLDRHAPAPDSETVYTPDEGRKKVRLVQATSRTTVIAVLAAFGLSGFVALCYEVIWSRVLALIIGSSVYAFSIMLTTFLIGLAAGASVASRVVDRIRRPVLVFAFLELGVGLASLAGAYLFNELPYLFVQLYRWIADSGFALLLLARFIVASMVMIAPTLLLGALFPLVVRIAFGSRDGPARDRGYVGRTVGNAYAVNTVGAIGGAFLSGFALIPILGLLGSLRLSVALNFAAAGVLFIISRGRVARPAGFVAATALVVAVAATTPPWDVAVMSSGVYRYAPAMSKMNREQFLEYFKLGNQGEAVYYKEGITATIVVQKQAGGRVLKVNGKPDASTGSDLPTQVLIGTLPLLIREKTDDVLVVGLGSGVTLGSVEQFPIKRVTCVELEPAVIEASRHFDDVNNRPLEDKRLTLVANDGRNFIDTTTEKFDVIISEPSNPWLTGVANLFTLEYFKRGAERLKEGGIFSQWLQIYEMPPEDVRTLVATFNTAFPYVHLFRGAGSDLMLLGSQAPVRFDLATIESHFRDPQIARDHNRVRVAGSADLISYYYFGPEGVAQYAAGSPVNTDDNALIEFRAPRRVGTADETVEANLKELLASADRWGRPPLMRDISPEDGFYTAHSDQRGTANFLLDAAVGAIARDDARRAEQFVRYSIDLSESARAYSLLGEIHNARGNVDLALEHWRRALAVDPNHFYTLINLGKFHLTRQEIERATSYLDKALQIEPDSARAHHLRGLAYQAVGDQAKAVAEYRLTLRDGKYCHGVQTFYLNFGAALGALGNYEEAAQMLEEYTNLAPRDVDGQYHLGAVIEILAERTLDDSLTYKAIDRLKEALALQPEHAMAHYYLSKAYRRLGRYDDADLEFELYERFLAR